jgi:membrane protease YdiL (CAAX protease family)
MDPRPLVPRHQTLLVLAAFPAASTVLSLALLDRGLFAWTGLDFFAVFWSLAALWYVAQVAIVGAVLRRNGRTFADIGFAPRSRAFRRLCIGYAVLAVLLVAFIEWSIRSVGLDPAKLADLSGLADITPLSTGLRVVFVLMGFAAAISEEVVYRGFAVTALRSYRVPVWLAVPLAAVPFVFQHGLKSIEHFAWFFGWGVVFGVLFAWRRSLNLPIAIHWLVILAALPAVLQALDA